MNSQSWISHTYIPMDVKACMYVKEEHRQTSCVRQKICTFLAVRNLRIIVYLLLHFVFYSFSSTLCKIQSKTEVYQTTSVPLFF